MIESNVNARNVHLPTTVCIIGAGAAGITLACELEGCGFPVILIDGGGISGHSASPQDFYRGVAKPGHPEPTKYRQVGFGGTTSVWGGRCVPLDPIDFEAREYVAHSGWPISYEDVARYYPRALQYCHAGAADFTPGSFDQPVPVIPGLAPDNPVVSDRIERYSPPTHFGKAYRDRLARSKNVTSLLGMRCLRLHRRPGEGAIAKAEFVNAAGERLFVSAAFFVLATGGIETTRLLFESDPDGRGLGNQHDQLGRFYACHFESACASLTSERAPVAFGFQKTRDGVYARRKLQLSAKAQRDNRLLNCVFRLHSPPYADATHGSGALSAVYLAKSWLMPANPGFIGFGEAHAASPKSPHVRNVLRGLPQIGQYAWNRIVLGALAARKLPYTLIARADGRYPLEFNSEQTPLEHSRVTLDDQVDCYGTHGVHIAWHLSEDDIRASKRAFAVLRDALQSTTNCRLEFEDDELTAALRNARPLRGHHLGTARMASTARRGVVDSDCAVHGLPNLYVASSAVFPTNGHANPTLTIVALAVRLASHLTRLNSRVSRADTP
jgi:hypothetical protein